MAEKRRGSPPVDSRVYMYSGAGKTAENEVETRYQQTLIFVVVERLQLCIRRLGLLRWDGVSDWIGTGL